MTPLQVIHPDLVTFGSQGRPLRPSKVASLLACPMSLVLAQYAESEGGKAAQTGSLMHAGVDAYHKSPETLTEAERIQRGIDALAAAREKFPAADSARSRTLYDAYVADKTNSQAIVRWCEEPVRLVLSADSSDPTGLPIVIQGTTDQVREDRHTGVLSVWDVKTGVRHTPSEMLLDYIVQQATYVLAARATLGKNIVPGGIICTAGYEKARTRVHVPSGLSVAQCEEILTLVPPLVAAVRRGLPAFRPSLASCEYCPAGKYPDCSSMFHGLYGV